MKHIIEKSVQEEIELTLENPRYINYLYGMYYRFEPVGDGKIKITSIVKRDEYFDLSIRFKFFPTDLAAFNLEKDYKEMSADEFNDLIIELFSKHNLLPIKELV